MIRTLDQLSFLEKLSLIDMSYSRLDNYSTCPSKYFFTYIEKLDRLFGPAAALGNVIHGVLQDVVGEDYSPTDMALAFEQHREVYDPDKEIGEDLIETGRQLMAEFYDRHGDEEIDVIGKELPFELVIGPALVRGFIDIVERLSDGSIAIRDYKTGRVEVTYDDIKDNLQVGIYALAVSVQFPGVPIYAELYYLRTGRHKGHTYYPEDMPRLEQVITDKVTQIINDTNFRATDEVRPCTYCDFARSGRCGIGKARTKNRRW